MALPDTPVAMIQNDFDRNYGVAQSQSKSGGLASDNNIAEIQKQPRIPRDDGFRSPSNESSMPRPADSIRKRWLYHGSG